MSRDIAKKLAPSLRRLLDAVNRLPSEGTYLEDEQVREAEEALQQLEEYAASEPEPWEEA